MEQQVHHQADGLLVEAVVDLDPQELLVVSVAVVLVVLALLELLERLTLVVVEVLVRTASVLDMEAAVLVDSLKQLLKVLE